MGWGVGSVEGGQSQSPRAGSSWPWARILVRLPLCTWAISAGGSASLCLGFLICRTLVMLAPLSQDDQLRGADAGQGSGIISGYYFLWVGHYGMAYPLSEFEPPQKKAEGELVTERVGGESASDMNTNATSLFGYLNRVGDASGGWGVNPWQAEPSAADG